MAAKLRCGSCLFLKNRIRQGYKKTCYEEGKNKGCPACKSWELNLNSLSEKMQNLIFQIGQCEDKDIPMLRWILNKQQILIEQNLPYRLGERIFFEINNEIYEITITNVSAKTIAGRTSTGISFTLSHESNIFKTRADIEYYIKIKREEKEQKKAKLKMQANIDPKIGFACKRKPSLKELDELETKRRQARYLKQFKPGTSIIYNDSNWKIKELKMETERAIIINDQNLEILVNLEDLTFKN